MKNDTNAMLKSLPKVDRLLEDARIKALIRQHPRTMVVDGIREYLENIRQNILNAEAPSESVDYETIVEGFAEWAESALGKNLKRAVNGLGIILHTGLGRAPIAEAAQQALSDVVAHYSTLQIDRETGKRGDRYVHVENLLKKITGAESALIVNNNAAATLLILNTLAGGKEVIVSRGELVEIGGSFRIPDVMKRSGAKLVEVGTTNRTHLKDYVNAINTETGLILRVHQSNYRIEGFTKRVPLEELSSLTHSAGLPIVDDLGSGALVDLSRWNLPKEPTVQESVRGGADVVCFSGDKLLGGPQCGIILGKKDLIDKIKKNQLTRALRCDKMTYAVLEATLRLFLDEETLLERHPVLRMLTESRDAIKKRCQSLQKKLKAVLGSQVLVEIIQDVSEVGSGSLAAEVLPTWVLSIHMDEMSTEELARKLRLSDPPIFGRVKEDAVLLDCRTIRKDEFVFIIKAFRKIIGLQPEDKRLKQKRKRIVEKIVDEVREIEDRQNE